MAYVSRSVATYNANNSILLRTDDVLKKVQISRSHLEDKSKTNSWYEISNELYYFKPRDDYNLFSELFSSIFGKEFNFDVLQYFPCLMNGILGVMSKNFQTVGHEYIMASHFYENGSKDNISYQYGEYCLKSLLMYFKDSCSSTCYKEIKAHLLELFLFDYLSHQTDRNYNNLMFEKDRYSENIGTAVIFDNENGWDYGEKISGNANGLGYKNQIWKPALTFECGLVTEETDEVDMNMFALCMEYFDDIKHLFNYVLSSQFNIEKAFTSYQMQYKIEIPTKIKDMIRRMIEDKQKGISKLLTM